MMPVVAPTVMPVPPKPMTLLHVPPVTASDKVMVEPIHTVSLPLIVAIFGSGFTETTAVEVFNAQAAV